MKADQLKTIVDKMPTLADGTSLKPEDYPQMIKRYFETPFRGCDYKIFYFFAGDVRDKLLQNTAQKEFEQIQKVHDIVMNTKYRPFERVGKNGKS